MPGIFLLMTALTLAGCVVLEAFGVKEKPFAFSHRLHVEEEGLECLDCHATVETSEDSGMPVLRQCMLCHEEIDEEKPPERRIDGLFVDGKYAAALLSSLEDEVIFSHVAHVSGEYDCAACHGQIEQSDAIEDEVRVSMEDCIACHSEGAIADECSTCHREVDQDWRPGNHEHQWKKLHGRAIRADSGRLMDRCQLCHQESTCIECHAVEPPENHNNYWRRRGHSVIARLDRRNCEVCHRPSFCDRCHQEVEPINHVGMWGSTLNTHCLSCHFPLRAQGCVTCHKGTPSHLLAAPKPPDHFPGLNCLQCHGISAPLPHVDNGSDCNICHL